MIGSTGCSDVYGYNLIVSYAGEGGRYLQVEGEEAYALLPPSPIRRRFARSNPRKEGGAAGPLSIVLARSPMIGGVWLQRCYEVAAPVWVPRSLGGRTKHPPSISSPQCGLVLLFRHPRPAGLWWISSLRWTKDMKQHSVHTQAVQPSYSWARLSMLVASLMTKSTCNQTGNMFHHLL